MSLDIAAINAAITAYGPVIRILIVRIAGSAPRGAGTSMLVWANGQDGTIGGGALEHMAVQMARDLTGPALSRTIPLGPDLGQCCGGSVTLVWERCAAAPTFIRPVNPDADMLAKPSNLPAGALPRLKNGWLTESPPLPRRPVWIYGAGHVGRALVGVMTPLPDLAITWVDTHADRFPETTPDVTQLIAADPATAARFAPANADHLILTYSHAIDLALCHALLGHATGSIGLIGSATKWARFRARLTDLGHSAAQISRIACPIGDRALGKHPQAIALGVAGALLRSKGNDVASGAGEKAG